jgi:hypothetical protein
MPIVQEYPGDPPQVSFELVELGSRLRADERAPALIDRGTLRP